MKNLLILPSLLALAIFAGFAGSSTARAQANPTYNGSANDEEYDTDIQDNDLINSANVANDDQTIVVSSNSSVATDNGSFAGMTDGTGDGNNLTSNDAYYGIVGSQGIAPGADGYTAPTVLTYTLNTTGVGGSPLGYTITEIQSIAGWVNNYDSSQAFSVAFETVGSSTFVNYDGGAIFENDAQSGDNYATQTLITDDSGALAENVKAIKFYLYQPDAPSNGTVYLEIDVDGAASLTAPAVPEPASYGFLLLGGVAVLAYRFRRQVA